MKKALVATVVALGVLVVGGTSAQAGGCGPSGCGSSRGFGWNLGLRLSGDCSFSRWQDCHGPSCNGPHGGGQGYGAPNFGGPAYWPMPAPAPYAYAAPAYPTPAPAHHHAPAPTTLPAPAPAPAPVTPTGYFQLNSYNTGSQGYIFPAVAPSYWR